MSKTITAEKMQQLALHKLTCTQANQTRLLLPTLLLKARCSANETTLRTTRASIRAVAIFLRNSIATQATTLVDIAAMDKPSQAGRFPVKYLFLSAVHNRRLTIELFVDETLSIPSLSTEILYTQRLFSSAG